MAAELRRRINPTFLAALDAGSSTQSQRKEPSTVEEPDESQVFERCYAALPLDSVHRLHEADMATRVGGTRVLRETSHAYGEIQFAAFVHILHRARVHVGGDEDTTMPLQFVDLGSGIGKVIILFISHSLS